MQDDADELWRVAIELSDAAGFPYKNRSGVWVYPAGIPPQLSNDVIEAVKAAFSSNVFQAPQTPLDP